MSWLLQAILVVMVVSAAPGAAGDDARVVRVEVAGDDGARLRGARLRLVGDAIDGIEWVDAAGGAVDLTVPASDEPIHLVARAPGHAGRVIALDGDGPVTVVLDQGLPVEVQLVPPADTPLPEDLVPVVLPAALVTQCWRGVGEDGMHDFGVADVEPLGAGRFTFRGTADPVLVAVHHAGFLRWYTSEVLPAAAAPVEIRLPAPVRLDVAVTPADAGAAASFARCGLVVCRLVTGVDGQRGVLQCVTRDEEGDRLQFAAADAAPGAWLLQGWARQDPSRPEESYRDQVLRELVDGDLLALACVYQPFDASILQGDHVAVVTVTRQDGSAAAGAPYTVEYFTPRFGVQKVRNGRLSDAGSVRLEGLPGGAVAPILSFQVDGDRIGRIVLSGDEVLHRLAFVLPPRAGDVAPDLAFTDLATGATVRLSDFRGQVLLLDFWATWCGPCQAPMAQNSAVMARRAGDWKGRANILALSVDDSIDTLHHHVKRQGWENLRHLFCDEDGVRGWDCRAIREYGISGVPTGILIDRQNVIRWRGHPDTIDVEAEIDALLAVPVGG